jgi:hypothetical protein
MMFRQLYKHSTVGLSAALLLVMTAAAPVAAQQAPASGPNINPTARQGNAQATSADPCAPTTVVTDNANDNAVQDQGQDNAGQAADETAAATPSCPGTSQATAGPNFPGQVTVYPGTSQWYKFRYVFDEDVDDEPGNAVVSLKMSQAGCAAFDVTTSGRLKFPFDDDGDPLGPIGRGTPFDNGVTTDQSTLLWVGGGHFSETHYVIVRARGNTPCNYTLSITGSPVVF